MSKKADDSILRALLVSNFTQLKKMLEGTILRLNIWERFVSMFALRTTYITSKLLTYTRNIILLKPVAL